MGGHDGEFLRPVVIEVRPATSADAGVVAALLHDFNTEFGTPSPGPAVLAPRIATLLDGGDVLALLGGSPAVAVAVVSLRQNVWYDGPVALLDELYVKPASRSRGIGTVVLHEVEDAVRARRSEVLEINVDGQDVDARRFYERHGYSCVEPGQREPSLLYSRGLTASGPGP